jgi:glycosyltransferase involved in cell wall biosynthesis
MKPLCSTCATAEAKLDGNGRECLYINNIGPLCQACYDEQIVAVTRLSANVQPLVSICIPTYNRPQFCCDAIRSCLAQTYQNFEIIVTDNSEEPSVVWKDGRLTYEGGYCFVADFTDSRINYHWNWLNIGATDSTNRALRLARGKYIKILMDDDLLKPRCLEQQVAALEANERCSVACAPMDLVDATGKNIEPYFYLFRKTRYRYRYQVGDGVLDKERLLRDFLTRDYPCCVVSGVMFRTSALREVLPCREFGFAGDLDLMMRLAAKRDFFYLDEVLSSWRMHGECHTARLHSDGHDVRLYYKVTKEALCNESVQELFGSRTSDEFEGLVSDAMFFCDARACLNFIPALKRMDWRLFLATLRVMHDNFYTGWLGRVLLLPPYLLLQVMKPLLESKEQPPRQP